MVPAGIGDSHHFSPAEIGNSPIFSGHFAPGGKDAPGPPFGCARYARGRPGHGLCSTGGATGARMGGVIMFSGPLFVHHQESMEDTKEEKKKRKQQPKTEQKKTKWIDY